jgi:hypothetical protein
VIVYEYQIPQNIMWTNLVNSAWPSIDLNVLFERLSNEAPCIYTDDCDFPKANVCDRPLSSIALWLKDYNRAAREAIWSVDATIAIGVYCYLILLAQEQASGRFNRCGSALIETDNLINDFGAELCIGLASSTITCLLESLTLRQRLVVVLSYAAVDWSYSSGTITDRIRNKVDSHLMSLV